MTEYRTHRWPDIVASFRCLAEANGEFAPLRDAVELLAASRYAAGLYPVHSMHTLRLFKHEHWTSQDEEVRLDFEDGAFVVRHRAGATPDPRFTLVAPAGIWTKRGTDALVLLERAFHHLSWFVEYRSAAAEPVPPAV